MALTLEEKGKYLDSLGYNCPYCGSDDISYTDGITAEGGTGFQPVYCVTCKKEWTDVFKLINIVEK
jgi:transposase-like protein